MGPDGNAATTRSRLINDINPGRTPIFPRPLDERLLRSLAIRSPSRTCIIERGTFQSGKLVLMTSDVKKLLDEALRLPTEVRAALAGSLIESLDETVDEDAESAWAEKIQRRIEEIESGTVKTVPWSKARRMILGH